MSEVHFDLEELDMHELSELLKATQIEIFERLAKEAVGNPTPDWPLPFQPPRPTHPQPEFFTNHCGVCGMKFDGIMNYVCARSDCPSKVLCSYDSVTHIVDAELTTDTKIEGDNN